MATTRIKDLSKTATTVASDANIVIDGPSNGTQKITRDNFRQDTADAFVAAPSTYKLAPLNGVNKIDATYLPTSGDTPKGEWNASSNSPALADGSGVAGDYYDVTTAGTQNLGSGSITFTVGDVVKYNGSTWFKIDSVANILDGSATAADGRSALSVNSKDEDAQANALKVTAPALYFDGSNDFVQVADDAKLSFTDGTDDLPFSVSAWVKMDDATNFTIASKYGSSGSNYEWLFYVDSSDLLHMYVTTANASDDAERRSDSAITSREGEWVHLAMTYNGAGPNSNNGFSAAGDGITFYLNGEVLASTAFNDAGYTGMANTAQAVWLGRFGNSYTKGSIRGCKIFNRSLTASEVAELARGNDLGFSEEWGGANGGVYTSDFSAGVDGWTASNVTADGNIDGVLGVDDTLRLTANSANSIHSAYKNLPVQSGKRYKLTVDYYIPSGQSNVDGFAIFADSGGPDYFVTENTATLGAWTQVSGELVFSLNGNTNFYIQLRDGGASTFSDAGADDVAYFKNLRLTEIGCLADFRAENYDPDSSTLADISDNAFLGYNNGATFVGNGLPPHAATRQQLAETNALKTTAPALYFTGSSSYVTVAQDPKLSFTDGVNDTGFSFAFKCRLDSSSAVDRTLISKFNLVAAEKEYRIYHASNNRIYAERRSTSGADLRATYSTINPITVGEWAHVAVVFNAAGPDTATAFASATHQIFVNGIEVTDTSSSVGTYTGMSTTNGQLRIGAREGADYWNGHIRDAKIFNRELTATEIAELARGNDLGFADEWGTNTEKVTDGGMETWASGTDLTNWTEGPSITLAQESSDVQSGTYSAKLTGAGDINGSNSFWLSQSGVFTNGKRYRVKFAAKRVSGTTDYLQAGQRYYEFVRFDGSTFTAQTNSIISYSQVLSQTALGGGWYSVVVEVVGKGATDLTFGVSGSSDPYLLDSISVVQIGTLADFRAERYDTSTNKLYDLSDNAFVGTGTSVTLTGREVPVYEHGTWTPGLEFGGGTTGLTYAAQEGHYTRIGNQVTIHGFITLSAKGSSTGNARITGLPYTSDATTNQLQSGAMGYGSGLAGLTSIPTMTVVDNDTDLSLHDWGATGAANLDQSNFTDTSNLRFSLTYQIQ
jgi:hypothetical protein